MIGAYIVHLLRLCWKVFLTKWEASPRLVLWACDMISMSPLYTPEALLLASLDCTVIFMSELCELLTYSTAVVFLLGKIKGKINIGKTFAVRSVIS